MNKFNKTLLASSLVFAAAGANAAAFQLAEVSTSGLGMAYAGNAAVADNASVIATNPALMTKFKRPEISAGGVLVDTDITVRGSASGTNPLTGATTTYDFYAGNVIPTSVIPNLYFVKPVTDRFALGFGYNVNYGLESKYEKGYNAGYFGGHTSLAAHNFNFSAAYDVGHGFNIGAGVNAIYSKAEVERNLGVAGKAAAAQAVVAARTAQAAAVQAGASAQQAAAAGNAALAQTYATQAQTYATAAQTYAAAATYYNGLSQETVIAKIKGNEWSFGWNAGVSYDVNENHRFGLAYHSAVNVKFKGKYSNELAMPLGSQVPNVMNGSSVDGRLTLALPAYWEFSGWHKLTDKLAVQYSYKYTEWERLKSLDAYAMDGSTRYFHKEENFSNASRYALGLSYDASEAVTLRAGVAYDESASKRSPSISIPDTNRVWYSVGATYRVTPNLAIDAGYAFLRGTSNSFNEEGRGDFKVKARANLYGLNVNYKF